MSTNASTLTAIAAVVLALLVIASAAFIVVMIQADAFPGGPVVLASSLAAVAGAALAYLAIAQAVATRDRLRHLSEALALERADRERQSRELRSGGLESERAGRRLAAQVGDALAGIARIASESTAAHARAVALSEQVNNGAAAMEEIQASVESLVRQIAGQSELVEQSAAAIEEISANIESVANVARNKRTAAERLAELTARGTETVSVSERLIDEVSESVVGVTSTVGVINTIAAQTNLLAMNAAIEAAHAGSYGRGFAVVASEIRSLAESTSKNAGEIKRTLAELRAKMSEAQQAGVRSGDAFREIQDEAQSVSAAFGEITLSTEELATGTSEVVQATEQLRNIASQTRSSSEEMRIAAGEVTEILTATRETSRATAQAMDLIGSSARNVSSASSAISTQTIENNTRISDLLGVLAAASAEGTTVASAAHRRLDVANIILAHLNWVGQLRALVDGDPDAFDRDTLNPARCALGTWLDGPGAGVIRDAAALERLTAAHGALHDAGRRIVGAVESRTGATADIEAEFASVLDSSRTVSEILSSFEEDELVWSPALSVRVRVFDEHHQRLILLINRLYEAMRNGSDRDTLAGVFDDLVNYTVYHFSAEERAFEKLGYPHDAEHHELHDELIRRVKQLRSDFDAGKPMIAVEVMQFLRDWILEHIQVEDAKYAEFFTASEITDSTIEAVIA